VNISSACIPPTHATISDGDRAHPRFNEYLSYRSAMTCQLVRCDSFESWLRQQEDFERGQTTVFQAGEKCDPGVFVPLAWYVRITAPRSQRSQVLGPFNCEGAARAAIIRRGP
jgi:hypothetical protein